MTFAVGPIEAWPGPAHGLRAGPARRPRPGPYRTQSAWIIRGGVHHSITVLPPSVYVHDEQLVGQSIELEVEVKHI